MDYFHVLIVISTLLVVIYFVFKYRKELKNKLVFEYKNAEIDVLGHDKAKIQNRLNKLNEEIKFLKQETKMYENDAINIKQKFQNLKDNYVLELDLANQNKINNIKRMEFENALDIFINNIRSDVLNSETLRNIFFNKMKKLSVKIDG